MARRTVAADIKAMRLLIDHFGADIAVQWSEPMPRSRQERMDMIVAVETDTFKWHHHHRNLVSHCALTRGDHSPIFPDWADPALPRESRLAVIGPSPGPEDSEHGETGWSRWDRTLAAELRRAGIAGTQVTWLYCVWCWPDGGVEGDEQPTGRGKGRRAAITRPPSDPELAAWHPSLMAALDAADVSYVLLHGSQAVHAWRPDLSVKTASKGQGLWNNRWLVTAVNHASSIARERDPVLEREWKNQIGEFAQRFQNGISFDDLPRRCSYCGSGFYTWDEDGIAVCGDHLKSNFGKAAKARKLAKQHSQQRNQGEIL